MATSIVGTASAMVTQTIGSGSAVSTITNSADFELNTTLSTPYSEGGLVFTYNGSTDNNTCGYAGCTDHSGFYPGFSGNYMYSVGTGTFISIKMSDGRDFFGIEFAAGSGFSSGGYGFWETLNDGVITGNGDYPFIGVQVLGLADASGFDEVRYYNPYDRNDSFGYGAPAIDTVRVGTSDISSIPEPGSLALLAVALLGLGTARRKI